MSIKIIFSCQADFHGVALQEILAVNNEIKFIKWLGGGVGLLDYAGEFDEFSQLIKAQSLIFLRHIFPAEYTAQDINFIQDFEPRMSQNKNFSVQIRASENNKIYKPPEIKEKITDYFKQKGFAENKRDPEQIISVYLTDNNIYAGLSQAEQNLSIWSGGMRHYAMREDIISRAGFKLMEALEAYPIDFNNSTALDLGAAPGGWTKVLLDYGLRVTAVDPVELSPELQANKNVEYYQERAHEYIKKSNKKFNLIVNDMSMNIFTSINFILSLKNRLNKDGHIIITFKLTKQDRLNKIKDGLKILSNHFEPVFIRQLFHNRSEITVILKKN